MMPPDENPSGLGMFSYDLRFLGQVFDRETNNHYNHFRDYDPQTGRYIESDPIGLNGGINTYVYANSNPLILVDFLGLNGVMPTTIGCDGNDNLTVINNDHSPTRDCTQTHEQTHVNDWVKRYGKGLCQGKPKGFVPMASVNGDNVRNFTRDSECRAYTAEEQCVLKCGDKQDIYQHHRELEKYYCNKYNSWQSSSQKDAKRQ
jgi:RHS repeat-associated protein